MDLQVEQCDGSQGQGWGCAEVGHGYKLPDLKWWGLWICCDPWWSESCSGRKGEITSLWVIATTPSATQRMFSPDLACRHFSVFIYQVSTHTPSLMHCRVGEASADRGGGGGIQGPALYPTCHSHERECIELFYFAKTWSLSDSVNLKLIERKAAFRLVSKAFP